MSERFGLPEFDIEGEVSITVVVLHRDLAAAAATYLAATKDPVWYNLTDLINDCLAHFLFEKDLFPIGIPTERSEHETSDQSEL